MREETIYYAMDDTEFWDKDECEAYEKRINDSFSSVIFFDDKMCRIEPVVPETINAHCWYVAVLDRNGASTLFRWLSGYSGFNAPEYGSYSDGDIFEWRDDAEKWVNIKEEVERLSLCVAALELEVKNGIKV